jgi:hypothetical protein
MPESLDVLIARLDAIEADLQSAVRAHRGEITAVAPEHRTGATNLVRYTTLRQKDLRDLQNDLLDLGATSLANGSRRAQAPDRTYLRRARRRPCPGVAGRYRPADRLVEAVVGFVRPRDHPSGSGHPGRPSGPHHPGGSGKGPHVAEAISVLDGILERMDEVQQKSRTLMRRIHSWDGQ